MKKSYSQKINPYIIKEIINCYGYLTNDQKQSAHILLFAKEKDLTITIYKNFTLLLQGQEESIAMFLKKFNLGQDSIKEDTLPLDPNQNIIGCDEVGTGDYFGPVVTCACFVKKEIIGHLKQFHVVDSKSLSDGQILFIAQQIKPYVHYQFQICWPKEYNQLIEKYHNSNIIKAILHNQNILQLSQELDQKNITYKIVLDQFVNEKKYAEYLTIAQTKTKKIDLFIPKAETKYLAVAAASILARAIFIQSWRQMEQSINLHLPFGSTKIDQIVRIGKKIIKKNHSLSRYAKLHFASITDLIQNKK